MTRARYGPKHHDQRKSQARPKRIGKLPAAGIHERIRQQKRRLQIGKLLVRERDVSANGFDRHWQRLPVQIADRDGRTD